MDEQRSPAGPDTAATIRIGRYEVLRSLGSGTSGEVFACYDPVLERQLALKVLRADLPEEVRDAYLERFRIEVRVLGKLSHPNIVGVHDAGLEGERPFLAMELCSGPSLDRLLWKAGPIPPSEVFWVIDQLAAALDYVHGHGIVHRDVKPGNLIFHHQCLKLTDFGIAHTDTSQMTMAGDMLGTPSFMAPEQVMGRAADRRADLWAVGVMAFQMLSGRRPFTGDSPTVLYKITHESPPLVTEINPALPEALNDFFERALAFESEGRFSSGSELLEALMQVFPDQPIAPLSGLEQWLHPAPANGGVRPGSSRGSLPFRSGAQRSLPGGAVSGTRLVERPASPEAAMAVGGIGLREAALKVLEPEGSEGGRVEGAGGSSEASLVRPRANPGVEVPYGAPFGGVVQPPPVDPVPSTHLERGRGRTGLWVGAAAAALLAAFGIWRLMSPPPPVEPGIGLLQDGSHEAPMAGAVGQGAPVQPGGAVPGGADDLAANRETGALNGQATAGERTSGSASSRVSGAGQAEAGNGTAGGAPGGGRPGLVTAGAGSARPTAGQVPGSSSKATPGSQGASGTAGVGGEGASPASGDARAGSTGTQVPQGSPTSGQTAASTSGAASSPVSGPTANAAASGTTSSGLGSEPVPVATPAPVIPRIELRVPASATAGQVIHLEAELGGPLPPGHRVAASWRSAGGSWTDAAARELATGRYSFDLSPPAGRLEVRFEVVEPSGSRAGTVRREVEVAPRPAVPDPKETRPKSAVPPSAF